MIHWQMNRRQALLAGLAGLGSLAAFRHLLANPASGAPAAAAGTLTIGGDLTISRYNRDLAGKAERHTKFKGAYIDDDNLDVVRTVTYDKNLAVLFINSLDSVHGVTVRQPSPHSRLFVNLVGEIDPPLYNLEADGKAAHYLPANQPRTPVGLTDRIVPMVRRMFG